MDVALVITELEPGGAERCLVRLAIGLIQRGHSVNVISIAPEPCSGRDELVIELRENGIEPNFLAVSNFFGFFRAKRRLRLLLNKLAPQIVQSFLFHANILCSKVCYRGGFKLFGGLRVSAPRKLRQWMLRLQRANFHQTICVSDDVSSYAQRQLRYPLDKLSVIPNGIDLDHFDTITPTDVSELGFDAPVLTFIGRLHTQKGVDLITANAHRVLTACPQHHIAIVGDGPHKQSMQNTIRDNGLEHRVHFYGYRPDAIAILKSSQLLLFPSRWEGMPNVVIEAMAAKRPIVACPADGVTQLLSHAPEQIVAPEDWSAAVIEFALNAARCDAIGKANRTVVSGSYQLPQMINQYEELYQRTLQPS